MTMLQISEYISSFPEIFSIDDALAPWEITSNLNELVKKAMLLLDHEFVIKNGIAIHNTAKVEQGVSFHGPVIICANCRIGANAYFREGVFIDRAVNIGPGCEIKSSIICSESAVAHLNYIGNSIIGNRVNFEAGSIGANHYNERENKAIRVKYKGKLMETGVTKFGCLVGDDSKIGANAVLSPGTILDKNSIVKRLSLVEQV